MSIDMAALWEQRFLATLRNLSVLLRQHGVERWAAWFESDLADFLAAAGPPRQVARQQAAVEHVLTAFGGMSSFRQLVLTDTSGQPLAEANDRLRALETQLWATARSVQGFLTTAAED
jgi:hypothetical protein